LKYIEDERYQESIERRIKILDKQDEIEAERPIKLAKYKAWKKEYVKQYQIENNFIAKKQKRREENREAYNSYMREYFKRKRAEKRAQKEQAGKNQGKVTDNPDKPTK